jgi:hypothetical protein
MTLTGTEQAVVRALKKAKAATKSSLCEQLGVCHMTVVRALSKYGYYNSYNRNAAFYTLADTPAFDENGLWSYRGIGFSVHGNLNQTLVSVVGGSSGGLTVEEVEALIHTPAATVLSRLCGQGRLGRWTEGRRAVYGSASPRARGQQQAERQRRTEQRLEAQRPRVGTPAGVEALRVIMVLREMIVRPRASVQSLAKRLREQEVEISAKEVAQIKAFYALQKKGAH